MENLFVTYKFYTERGDRLAIFGQEWGGKLKIVLIRCSKKDMFSKYSAKWAYSQWACGTKTKYHPIEFTINILNGETVNRTFNRWCNDNWYKKVSGIVPYTAEILYKGGKTKILYNTAKKYKKILL